MPEGRFGAAEAPVETKTRIDIKALLAKQAAARLQSPAEPTPEQVPAEPKLAAPFEPPKVAEPAAEVAATTPGEGGQ